MFLVIGKIGGEQYRLKYDNGTLTGDFIAWQKAEAENKKDHGNLGIPPNTKTNYLAFEDSAHMLITTFVFDEVISTEDDWPEVPDYADI